MTTATDIHRRRTDYRWALLANAVRHRGAAVLAECNALADAAVTRDTAAAGGPLWRHPRLRLLGSSVARDERGRPHAVPH